MTTSSSWLGPLAMSQVAKLTLKPAARKSASTPGQVGEAETNARERGWSRRNEYGRISRAARSITSVAGFPSSGGASMSCFSSSCWKSPSQAPSPGSFSIRSTRSSAALRARSSISSGAIRRPSFPGQTLLFFLPICPSSLSYSPERLETNMGQRRYERMPPPCARSHQSSVFEHATFLPVGYLNSMLGSHNRVKMAFERPAPPATGRRPPQNARDDIGQQMPR